MLPYPHLCTIVPFTQDLLKATQPRLNLTSSDLATTLAPVKSTHFDHNLYVIDKVVRRRMSEGVPFGFDGSELLQLNLEEGNWGKDVGGRLRNRLEAAGNKRKRGLSFEEWKIRKEAEKRLKKRLLEDIEAEEKAEKAENMKFLARQKEKNKAKVARWRNQKKAEALAKRKQGKIARKQSKAAEIAKRAESQQSYMNWLRGDLVRRRENGHVRGKSVGNNRKDIGRKYREMQSRKEEYSASAVLFHPKVSGPRVLAYSLSRKSDLSGSQHSQDYSKGSGLHPSLLDGMEDWSDISVEVHNLV